MISILSRFCGRLARRRCQEGEYGKDDPQDVISLTHGLDRNDLASRPDQRLGNHVSRDGPDRYNLSDLFNLKTAAL